MDATPETIKEDIANLQKATADAVAWIEQASTGYQVSQEQLNNLHAALEGATKDLSDAVAAAG